MMKWPKLPQEMQCNYSVYHRRIMASPYYESREDRSGKLFEHFLFGDITAGKNTIRYREMLKKYAAKNQGKGNPAYLPFQDALDLARDAQGGDPSSPQKKFMRDVREAVMRRMRLSEKEARNLGIYSAVGTPLDVYHGVDAFVAFKQPQGKERIVTMDATINKEKIAEERIKAQIMIAEVPDPQEQAKEYQTFVENIAGKIVIELAREAH